MVAASGVHCADLFSRSNDRVYAPAGENVTAAKACGFAMDNGERHAFEYMRMISRGQNGGSMYDGTMNRIPLWMSCLVLLAGCATQDIARDAQELLPDPTFSQWISIRGLGQPWDDGNTKGVFRTTAEQSAAPVWRIGQWASKHSLADPAVTRQTQLNKHRFLIENPSKRVIVDSRRGEFELGITASACYDRPRQANEPWPHLLVETALTDKRYPGASYRVETMRRLDVAMDCRLTGFKDNHPEGAKPSLHAAQFQLFLYVQNLNTESPGYGDMLWFGIPIFDNRRPASDEHYQRDGGKPDASGKFIYILPTNASQPKGSTIFKDGKIVAAPNADWMDIRVDALPWIHRAYELARKGGYFPQTEFTDLYVSGLNLGWEMPGIYDATMQVRGFSIRGAAK